jgi:hypothetical protein
MDNDTKESGRTILRMVKELACGRMGTNIVDNGKQASITETAHIHGQTARSTKENGARA